MCLTKDLRYGVVVERRPLLVRRHAKCSGRRVCIQPINRNKFEEALRV